MSIEDWVAQPGQGPTRVIEPVYIEYTAIGDLLQYHPRADANNPMTFKLLPETDAEGPYARFDVADGVWHADWRRMLADVKLRVSADSHGTEILEDKTSQRQTLGTTHDWHVINWQVVRSRDDRGIFLQEIIRWENEQEDRALSSYSWIPY